MSIGYYTYLYKSTHPIQSEDQHGVAVKDEAIGRKWNKKITLYCKGDCKSLLEEISKNENIVAFFIKDKDKEQEKKK